jgi:hypothetical protein
MNRPVAVIAGHESGNLSPAIPKQVQALDIHSARFKHLR